MKLYSLLAVFIAACSGSAVDELTDAGPDSASGETDGGLELELDGSTYIDDAGNVVQLANFTPTDGGPLELDSSTPGATDAGDAGNIGDAMPADTGPAGPMLGLCELCEMDADCAAGVCAVANSTGQGLARCLPDCSTEQDTACGEPFGWRREDQTVNDRLWLCYDHGACGPVSEYCSLRWGFPGRASCIEMDYCEAWLEAN
jgi:hypothetical protein